MVRLVVFIQNKHPVIERIRDIKLRGETFQPREHLRLIERAKGEVVDDVGEVRHDGVEIVGLAAGLDVEVARDTVHEEVA